MNILGSNGQDNPKDVKEALMRGGVEDLIFSERNDERWYEITDIRDNGNGVEIQRKFYRCVEEDEDPVLTGEEESSSLANHLKDSYIGYAP